MSRPNATDADIRTSEHGTVVLLIIFGIALGFVTIAGHAQRWSAPAYQVALEVPGAPESWGWALFVTSIVALFGYYNSHVTIGAVRFGFYCLTVGLFMMGIWCLFFGVAFLLQFIGNNTVSANGALINAVLSILYIQRAVMYWRGGVAFR